MSDKYNNDYNSRRNDIDDFFAEFDRQAASQNRPSSRKSDSTRYSASSYTEADRRNTRRSSASRSSKAKAAASMDSLKSSIAKRSSSKGSSSRGGRSGGKAPSKKSNLLSIVLFGGLAFVMAIGIYVGVIFATAPKVDTDDIYSMLAQRSIIYDSEGREIENLYMDDGNSCLLYTSPSPRD